MPNASTYSPFTRRCRPRTIADDRSAVARSPNVTVISQRIVPVSRPERVVAIARPVVHARHRARMQRLHEQGADAGHHASPCRRARPTTPSRDRRSRHRHRVRDPAPTAATRRRFRRGSAAGATSTDRGPCAIPPVDQRARGPRAGPRDAQCRHLWRTATVWDGVGGGAPPQRSLDERRTVGHDGARSLDIRSSPASSTCSAPTGTPSSSTATTGRRPPPR